MKPTTTLKIQRKELSDALQAASRVTLSQSACEKKSVTLIYSCIVFRMNDNFTMQVLGSDCKKQISIPVILIDRKGDTRDFAISACDIVPIIRRLDDQELTIELYEYQATVRHTYGSFTVPFVKDDLEGFFERRKRMEEIYTTHTMEVEAPFFRSMLDRLCRYTEQDELRSVIAGINIRRRAGKINYVATNGKRLMRITKPDTALTLESSVIIPLDTVKVLRHITPRTGFITIVYSEWEENSSKTPVCRMTFNGDTELWFTPIEGRYPNYDSVIPKSYKWKFKIQRTHFVRTLDRLDLFCPKINIINLRSYKDKITLSAQDHDFGIQASESLPAEHETNNFNIQFGIQIANMQAILNSLKGADLYIQGEKEASAMTITPGSTTEGEEITIIFMPCLYNEEIEEQ